MFINSNISYYPVLDYFRYKERLSVIMVTDPTF